MDNGAVATVGLPGRLLIAWFGAGLAVRLRDARAHDEGTVAASVAMLVRR
jgi:hypothetical protein